MHGSVIIEKNNQTTMKTLSDSSNSFVLKGEIKRFVLGGLTTLVVCLTTMWLLVGVAGFNNILSLNLTAAVGYLYSYCVNKILVFRRNEQSHLIYGSRFLLLQGVLLLLNNALFYAGVNWLGWHYLLVNCVIAVLMSVLNFILLKLTVFR
jgi:putative flippase GtrA